MATQRAKRKIEEIITEPVKKGDLAALTEHMRQNPLLYLAAVVFIVLCAIAGGLYRVNAMAQDHALASLYARSLENEDPALRAKELEQAATEKGAALPEVLYMLGESAFQAQDYDKAQSAFERVRKEFPSSSFAPDATEGLGYVAEQRDDSAGAVKLYEEILLKWPDTFAARRQLFNKARCQERLGDLQSAADSYQRQVAIFPDSKIAAAADTALRRLRKAQPELFPDSAAAKPSDVPSLDSGPAGTASSVPTSSSADQKPVLKLPDLTPMGSPEPPASEPAPDSARQGQ